MLTIKQAAEMYHVDESTIWKAVNTGKIKTKQMTDMNDRGRPIILLKESEVEEWNKGRKRPYDRNAKISLYQACELTGLAYSVVQRGVDNGEFPATQVPYLSKFKWQINREEFLKWAKDKPVQTKRAPEVVPMEKCDLKPGTKVKYKADAESRNNDYRIGQIEEVYDRFVVVKNENGYRECFSHFDYSQGELKRA